MNQRPLDEMVADAVARATGEGGNSNDVDVVVERVLGDPDIRLLLDGYRMHDRSEGLEDVIIRDIRKKVGQALGADDS